MGPDEIASFFNSNGLFEKTVVAERGSYLTKAGSVDTHIYFIQSGAVYAFIMDGDEERITRFGYTGNIIVPLDSFLTAQPSDLYIQAIKRTTVKIISKSFFQKFIQQTEIKSNLWATILENLVIQQMEREKDLLIQSPVERYKRVLKRSPQLFQQIPNKYIASYLRMSPETLSRLKKR
ncbi:Crp/Fnr family transcriptional regulator [Niabella aquatica]